MLFRRTLNANLTEAIPELQEAVSHPRSTDTPASSAAPGPSTSPAYVHSPVSNKRRRDSVEDDQEAQRLRQVPRLYHSPGNSAHRQPSPQARPPPGDVWSQPTRRSPFSSSRNYVPAPVEVLESVEPRHAMPTIPPSMATEKMAARPPTRDPHMDEYREHRHPVPAPYQQRPLVDTTQRYPAPTYEHSYHHPDHTHPKSPHHTYERTPFSAGPYARQYGEYSRYGELGHMGNDNKQRKRRGNLPKETTDKLRAWFMAHLSHPYPTEDEKQELMRQTNLQMSKFPRKDLDNRHRRLTFPPQTRFPTGSSMPVGASSQL